MNIRNDASSHIFLVLLAGRTMTGCRSVLNVPMSIGITKPFNALASLLAKSGYT